MTRRDLHTVYRIPEDLGPGQAVKMPSGAIYGRNGNGAIVRLNKPARGKKARRAARAAQKALSARTVEQLQAELAAGEA